jgi:hypothetical protein
MSKLKKLLNTIAITGDFDFMFPDLKGLPDDADRVPGRDLAVLILNGLRKYGFDTTDIIYDEPFFMIICISCDLKYQVLCFIYDPNPLAPVWIVQVPKKLGFWDRLMGKSEDSQLKPVLDAIEYTLGSDKRVKEMRWFNKLPAKPFNK